MMKYTPRVRSEMAPISAAAAPVISSVASRCAAPLSAPSLIITPVT